MKNSSESKKDKLEKILNCYGITWGELSELNDAQIKAIETDYFNRYGENISIMALSVDQDKISAVHDHSPTFTMASM